MKRIAIALLMLSIFACNKDESNEKEYEAICLRYTFSICDKEGHNLLDPTNVNSFAHDKIKCYEIYNGKKKYREVEILKSTNGFYFGMLFASIDPGEVIHNSAKGTSIIELAKGNIEKIEYEIEYTKNSAILDKLWYKGKKVYDRSILDTEAGISIIR